MSSAALPVTSMGLVMGQSAGTDSHTSILSATTSVVAGRADSCRSTPPPPPPPQTSLHLITDARKVGWGAHLEPLSLTVSGMWSYQESLLHINNLEMRAAQLAVTHFKAHLQDWCMMLSTDNTSAVSYVQAQGDTLTLPLPKDHRSADSCGNLNISLSAKHIPGRLNALADGLSLKHQLLPSE